MDKVERYLEFVPWYIVVGALLAALLGVVTVPGRFRLPLTLSFLMVWLTLGQLVELGFIHPLAKTTGFVAFLLVAVAASMHPGPRRPLPRIVWLYVASGLFGFLFIITVSDFALAFVIRLQWLVLVVAAIAVVRVIVDEASLEMVIRSLAVGMGIALLFPLSELISSPETAFKSTGRFNPYEVNPNHIGVLFALSPAIAGYVALQSRNVWARTLWLGVAVIAMGMGVITASRSTMAVMLGTLFPLAVAVTRRPSIVLLSTVVLAGGYYWVSGFFEQVQFERYIEVLESSRIQQLGSHPYYSVIAERPLFGLLETHGESFLKTEDIGTNPHNAYVEILYFGGMAYALPMFFLAGYTGWCTLLVWNRRRSISTNPTLINLLIANMVMIYAHGFANNAIHYPTTIIAFFHVLLSALFMGLAFDLRSGVYSVTPGSSVETDDAETWPLFVHTKGSLK